MSRPPTGRKTIPDPGGTTTDNPDDPNVCVTKIHPIFFRLAFAEAFDDPEQAVVIVFNRPVDPTTALNKANYRLESPPGTVIDLSPASVVLEIIDPSRVIVEGVPLTAGNLFILTVTGVKDTRGNTIPNDGINNRFKGTVQDVTPPRIATARFFTTDPHVELTFNEPLDVSSARNPFNYSVRATDDSEFPNIIGATYDGTTVKLTLDRDLTAGKEYEVTAFVRDLAGNFGSSSATGTAGTRAARVRSLR
jgi:hypothetical protein